MNASNLIVNFAIRSRNSSNPKLMLGRESAIEGASAEERGGRIALVEREGSNAVDMIANCQELCVIPRGCRFMSYDTCEE